MLFTSDLALHGLEQPQASSVWADVLAGKNLRINKDASKVAGKFFLRQ